ncbi:sulfatase family protein [Runella slithyformis]|uniref:N-acetylgalactosamine-6-sulfatase n=1 Tax=Runella slithyformis (strain ATCC 29530 / DSM 19594 / LMG 11500 / NCIMB 11436 / LSU 4) TaxID=761193 RepID=A0A7U4E6I6_RUNSL|nr:sulfatase-like hydrolase/transferase [Runella slithyformis]AEI49244.1 N-acetylgalactosamine-6-sulfatase [Runella slithyformis DSM 19594]
MSYFPSFIRHCCFLLFFTSSAFSQQKPNIVMILVDDMGWGEVGIYGSHYCQTPHLDNLAKQGMRFTNFYANSTVCSPTRAALMTGRYPDLVGVPGVIRGNVENSWGYFSPKAVTLPQVLKTAGYRTAMVGKWHLGLEPENHPNRHGFTHFHGFLEDMMDDYYTHLREGKNWMRLNGQVIDPSGHATDLFTQWAIEYLNTQKKNPQPFFLYLAYNAPHFPVQPPREWLEKVKKRNPNLSEKRAKLTALIEHLDESIGKVMEALRQNGQADNTLIVFSSDNGGLLSDEADNGIWKGGKQTMYEGGIRVPTIAVWKNKIIPGTKTDFRALTMDLFPTFCEAAGTKPPQAVDGHSFLSLLLGQPQTALNRTAFWVRREGGAYGGQEYYAVREGNWKILQNTPFEPFQLFDMAKDSLETTDVSIAQKAIYEALGKKLRKHIQKAGAVNWQK